MACLLHQLQQLVAAESGGMFGVDTEERGGHWGGRKVGEVWERYKEALANLEERGWRKGVGGRRNQARATFGSGKKDVVIVVQTVYLLYAAFHRLEDPLSPSGVSTFSEALPRLLGEPRQYLHTKDLLHLGED
ncbi:hypothetical protein R3P38DRAFT_2791338 [Favolaschia claudopus]|uniref:Uncharacterized protein n=1 Tax=Favolaschia claudopus TaxID=2862362 RepID=A0AAW0AHR4_9AGAR